jgi:reactive chlorine resistance protein C
MPLAAPRTAPIAAERLGALGGHLLRYGLAGMLLYFGALKFTAVEAEAIQPLLAHSPLLGWLYGVLSVQASSNLIGGVELLIAGLIALRPWRPALAAMGSAGAVGMFAVTLSFLVTTPGMWQPVPGFPLPVPTAGGGFLVKDVFLLGAALWSAGESWQAARLAPAMPRAVAALLLVAGGLLAEPDLVRAQSTAPREDWGVGIQASMDAEDTRTRTRDGDIEADGSA